MNKNIIITGSGGTLGTALRKKLLQFSDYKIFAITSQVDRLVEEYSKNSNVRILSSIEEVPTDLEYVVINCAFPRSSQGKSLATAFNYTEQLIKSLAPKKILRFVNISSQSVYAQTGKEIQTEEADIEPSNLYGMTKYAIERLVKSICEDHSMPYTNIRLGSLASATFDQRMINRFYMMIKNKETIKVDQGTPKVSYLHVEDAAAALTHMIGAIFRGEEVLSVYNLANNDWMLIPDLVEACLEYGEKMGIKRTKVIKSENHSEYNNVVSSEKFYNQFDWIPFYTMEKLISDIFTHKETNN